MLLGIRTFLLGCSWVVRERRVAMARRICLIMIVNDL